jgi:GntR family transcriptional regulator
MSSTVTVAIMSEPLSIDLRSPVPSYQQLAAQLRARIIAGEIGPDQPLPSITRIQQETGLAVTTIRRAIALLVEEGISYTVPGRGTYAARQPDDPR